ncbi:protein of unknown function [Burkholderia multivorans]
MRRGSARSCSAVSCSPRRACSRSTRCAASGRRATCCRRSRWASRQMRCGAGARSCSCARSCPTTPARTEPPACPAAGKLAKVVACMRKLLTMLNAMVRADTRWDASLHRV